MRKYNVLWGIALAFVVTLASCRTQPEAQPTATVRPAMPVPSSTDLKSDGKPAPVTTEPLLLQVRPDLSLTLPAGWSYRIETSDRGAAPTSLEDALLLAWIGDIPFAVAATRLSLVAVPRNRLTLDGYLDGVVRDSRADDRIRIVTTAVTTELRGDGLPAGEIIFTIDQGAGQRTRGYQVVLLDETGRDLVILTVVAPDAQWPDLLPAIEALVGGVVFERK